MMDGAYLGGKRGRDAAGKAPIVTAVATTAERRSGRLRLSQVATSVSAMDTRSGTEPDRRSVGSEPVCVNIFGLIGRRSGFGA